MKQLNYVIIPFVALGLVLSLAIGIEYNCKCQEMFPTYYGSPFVFKQKSLGSSMEYFYSISGLILNVLVWSLALFLIDKAIQRMIGKLNKPKLTRISYNILIGMLIAFTTLNIAMNAKMIGRGFEKESNYWYWDIDKEAENAGATCEGEMVLFTN
ncbi:MAG: hypothetical protein QE487_09235 [Fluviicola sp.]|nr:hypothetical protein [Fluviicola sp.]